MLGDNQEELLLFFYVRGSVLSKSFNVETTGLLGFYGDAKDSFDNALKLTCIGFSIRDH